MIEFLFKHVKQNNDLMHINDNLILAKNLFHP